MAILKTKLQKFFSLKLLLQLKKYATRKKEQLLTFFPKIWWSFQLRKKNKDFIGSIITALINKNGWLIKQLLLVMNHTLVKIIVKKKKTQLDQEKLGQTEGFNSQLKQSTEKCHSSFGIYCYWDTCSRNIKYIW